MMDFTPLNRINSSFHRWLLLSILLQQQQQQQQQIQIWHAAKSGCTDISDTQKVGIGRTTGVTETSGVTSIPFLPNMPIDHSLPVPSDPHTGLRNRGNPWHPVACQSLVSRQIESLWTSGRSGHELV